MQITHSGATHLTTTELARAMEKKRAVEQVTNQAEAPSIMRLNSAEKYASMFQSMLTQRESAEATQKPAPLTFPITV